MDSKNPNVRERSRMIKVNFMFLLLMAVAVTTFAGEKKFDVANIDKNLPLQKEYRIAEPLVTEKYDYYEIRGNDEKELRRQMGQNGTKWNDGETYDSATRWDINWDYGYDSAPQGCKVDSFRTILKITFRYPKWLRTDNAPQPLADKWDDYMKKLVMHENGHRDMALEAAEKISRAVAELPAARSCTDLDREVRALGLEIAAKLNRDEKEYDTITKHGTTQGAVFP